MRKCGFRIASTRRDSFRVSTRRTRPRHGWQFGPSYYGIQQLAVIVVQRFNGCDTVVPPQSQRKAWKFEYVPSEPKRNRSRLFQNRFVLRRAQLLTCVVGTPLDVSNDCASDLHGGLAVWLTVWLTARSRACIRGVGTAKIASRAFIK